jgi:hypothetical protein
VAAGRGALDQDSHIALTRMSACVRREDSNDINSPATAQSGRGDHGIPGLAAHTATSTSTA